MNNTNKVSSKYKSAWVLGLVFCILTVQSKDKSNHLFFFHNYLTALPDTIKPGKKRTVPPAIKKDNADSFKTEKKYNPAEEKKYNPADTLIIGVEKDTVDLKISKDSLDAPVAYNADDSMILDVPTKKITLYG